MGTIRFKLTDEGKEHVHEWKEAKYKLRVGDLKYDLKYCDCGFYEAEIPDAELNFVNDSMFSMGYLVNK